MKNNSPGKVLICFIILVLKVEIILASSAHNFFMIKAIDSETNRGIPLVEFKTMHNVSYFTDSNGIIAFYEPGLMGLDVFVNINGQGYEYSPDIFGYKGLSIKPISGDSIIIKLKRINVAERLYRSTGAGIYHDSYILGIQSPLKNPLLNGKVLGQDSNLSLIYNNKIFWIWGDTFKPAYPLGNFSVSGATSELPENAGLDPEIGIDYTYFTDATGFSKKMITIPGQGFVWLDWLIVLKDKTGKEQLVTKYARVKPNFENYERGIAIFNDEVKQFEKYKTVDEWIPYYHVNNHPFLAETNGQSFYYFTSEFTFGRVLPKLENISNPNTYHSFSCLKQGQKFDKNNLDVERDKNGALVWDWKKDTDAIGVNEQQTLIDSGIIAHDEGWVNLQDFYTGKRITTNRNSISWNSFRKKWILIAGVKVGETWYAEADTPIGPWVYAKKVLKHDKFFYNPVHHTFFDKDYGKTIFFEATYTNAFLQEKNLTPRYEYNQLMYKLSLDNPDLFMPEPVYEIHSQENSITYKLASEINLQNENIKKVGFLAFAPGREYSKLIPIYTNEKKLSRNSDKNSVLSFYALPPSVNESIDGKWEITMTDGVFFTNNFKISIDSSTTKIDVEIEQPGLSLVESHWQNQELLLSYSFFGEVFKVHGSLESGQLKGKWSNEDNSKSGTWNAICYDPEWQPVYSVSVVPLYEFISENSSDNYYSTSSIPINNSFTRSDLTICRVWEKPAKKLFYDFSIKWIGRN